MSAARRVNALAAGWSDVVEMRLVPAPKKK
jgi:hypothetical protein